VLSRALATLTVVLVTAAGLTVLVEAADPPAAEAAVTKKRLRHLVRSLEVAREVRRGYDRDKFPHWAGQGHGCDTRDRVLLAEARRDPRVVGSCDLRGGRWFSYYDGRRTRNPSTFDVDHLVPLAEAWDSGARRWNLRTRTRFANDLGDRRALVAVSASSNRSKSDRDPAEWLPRRRVRCRYVAEWTAIKTRWSLSVDRAEKRTLRRLARDCRNRPITVRTATVGLRRVRSGGGGGTGGGGGATDPRFDYCTDAIAAGYGPYVRGRDREYAWYTDADGDGVVCE
jgi:hypothetical protein